MKQERSPKPRNRLHDHPLMRKGGTHAKSRKAQRRAAKMDMRREWGPQSAFPQGAVPTTLTAGHHP